MLIILQGGAIKEFETLLGRPLQRALCLLHQVELPMRQLYLHYGGGTKGWYKLHDRYNLKFNVLRISQLYYFLNTLI